MFRIKLWYPLISVANLLLQQQATCVVLRRDLVSAIDPKPKWRSPSLWAHWSPSGDNSRHLLYSSPFEGIEGSYTKIPSAAGKVAWDSWQFQTHELLPDYIWKHYLCLKIWQRNLSISAEPPSLEKLCKSHSLFRRAGPQIWFHSWCLKTNATNSEKVRAFCRVPISQGSSTI